MTKPHNYRRLEPAQLIATIDALEQRIQAQFPERGITRICHELGLVARDAGRRVVRLQRPNWPLRLVPVAVTLLIIYLTLVVTSSFGRVEAIVDKEMALHLQELARALKLFLKAIAVPLALTVPLPFVVGIFAFMWRLESRWNRHRILRYLHELRSIIHVIDMHQLTKDPSLEAAVPDEEHVSREQLARYLDFCSEMLSLSGKVAALYAESSRDPVVIASVSDLGQITANLSNKIWQKLNIVNRNMLNSAGG